MGAFLKSLINQNCLFQIFRIRQSKQILIDKGKVGMKILYTPPPPESVILQNDNKIRHSVKISSED